MRVEPHEGLIPLKKRPPRAPYSIQHSKKSPAMNQHAQKQELEGAKNGNSACFLDETMSNFHKVIAFLQHGI